MSIDAIFTLCTLAVLTVGLATNKVGVDTAMLGALTLLLLAGVLEPLDAVRGFGDPTIVMIAALFIVVQGLVETGALSTLVEPLLGRPKGLAAAQLRMMTPVAAMSAFMNNTPIVAMYLPTVRDWARRLGISPSHLFMPLSFAAILGGACTLIGTASNVLVTGEWVAYVRDDPYAQQIGLTVPSPARQMWWSAAIGLPAALLGIALITVVSRRLLPARAPADRGVPDVRRYTLEMIVQDDAPIVGRTIEAAGLRHLPGLFLVEIQRGDAQLPAPGPDAVIDAGDVLVFAGIVDSVVDLRKIRGLVPATDQVLKVNAQRRQRLLVEAVVSGRSALVRRSIRESQFRTRYNAAIIAVHRGGERVRGRIGDIVLQAGDVLLLETHSGFVERHRNGDDFYLVSRVEGSVQPDFEKARIALAILGLFVALLTIPPLGGLVARAGALVGLSPPAELSPVVVALLCACLMLLTRCCTMTSARAAINWQVLIAIGAALGLGRAMQTTGAAEDIARAVVGVTRTLGPHGVLLVMFLLSNAMTQVITNAAAAVLMFPIMTETARDLGVSPEPFVATLMAAVACSFLTPVGYQTNLLVLAPGGYRFGDFVRLGLPLTVIVAIVAVVVAPIAFPF